MSKKKRVVSKKKSSIGTRYYSFFLLASERNKKNTVTTMSLLYKDHHHEEDIMHNHSGQPPPPPPPSSSLIELHHNSASSNYSKVLSSEATKTIKFKNQQFCFCTFDIAKGVRAIFKNCVFVEVVLTGTYTMKNCTFKTKDEHWTNITFVITPKGEVPTPIIFGIATEDNNFVNKLTRKLFPPPAAKSF